MRFTKGVVLSMLEAFEGEKKQMWENQEAELQL